MIWFLSLVFALKAGFASAPLQTKDYGHYRVSISRTSDGNQGILKINKGESLVYEEADRGSYYWTGPDASSSIIDRFSGRDINGDGKPDLVITKWNGGAHCCFSLRIFSLGENFRKVVEVEGGSNTFEFKDLDKDGDQELIFYDNPTDYMFSCYAESAQGRTILTFENGNYVIDGKHMRSLAPSKKKIQLLKLMARRELLSAKELRNLPNSFLELMMQMSYSGRINEAFQIVDDIWPPHLGPKEIFKRQFNEALSGSQYWSSFNALEIKRRRNR
jgi:hypothetical protein